MIDLVKVGAVLTLVGFFAVGSEAVVLGRAPLPTTPDEAATSATVAQNGQVVQGLGWILAGIGLCTALFGSAKSDTAVDMKSEILLQQVRPRSEGSGKQSQFVCSECGGDVSEAATTCPHCGEPITGSDE